jgi:two-component sensor histidine kinase
VKRILRTRLPERFADKVPPRIVEIAVSLFVVGLMTLLRVLLVPWTGDRAPFAFVFVAVVGATVLAGWRSGLLALVLGQLLAWNLIVDFPTSGLERLHIIGGFAIASLAQLMALAIIALYQREIDGAWSRREAQVDLIRQALAEIDHRTINNYQTVQSLVQAQANRSEGPVKEALQQVADRIRAIAMASKQLALSSNSLEEVRVTHHLGELCTQIRQGLSRPGIGVECHFDDVAVGAGQAAAISILVNELVTNALKYAFPDDRNGVISVALRRSQGGIDLSIEDNGVGMQDGTRGRGTGLGTRLVQTFTKQLGATHQFETGSDGTRHRIHIPAKS